MIDLSTSYLGLKLPLPAGRLGIAAVARSGWSLPPGRCRALPPLFSTRSLKSNCARKKMDLTIISPPAPRVSPNPSLTFRRRASSTLARRVISSTSARQSRRSTFRSSPASMGRRSEDGRSSRLEIERAGADAIECNIYYIPTDPELTAADVEKSISTSCAR